MDFLSQSLSTAFSVLFLLLLPFRLIQLRKATVKVTPGHYGYVKQGLVVVLLVIQLTILSTGEFTTSWFDPRLWSIFFPSLAYMGLFPLLYLEHTRSIRPSDFAVIYLLVSIACDISEIGANAYQNVALLPAIARLCVKFLLIGIESRGKKAILRDASSQWSPELLAGILNRTFFWWINSILARGKHHVLAEDSIPPIDHEISSKLLRNRALKFWDQRRRPETKMTLPKALVQSRLSHFLSPIIPRLFVIAFRYAQPVLISASIRRMSIDSSSDGDAVDARTIISMAAVVYVALAISKAVYQHRMNRLKVMTRGAVVGLINSKSFTQQASGSDGRAVALMSTDTDNVVQSVQMFHEAWAQVIEVALGIFMLAREVGWIFPVPLVIIFFCSRMSRYLAKNLQGKQKNWNGATQDRLSMTASMLSSMKSVKMVGFTTYAESLLHSLRLRELNMANQVRWMMVAYNASANALGIFSPILTFVLFALLAHYNNSALDTETAFTTTALLGLVTHPANMIMTIIPQAIGSLAAFERIQMYLLQPPRLDQRLTPPPKSQDSPAIQMEDVTIQGNVTPSMPPILRNVHLVVDKGATVIVSGPVGSGKTTLVRALIGEAPTTSGMISVSSKRIGYCEQSPWLPGGTLKEAVCGFMAEDSRWYRHVIRICCLDDDISALPHGDDTLIGSRGLNLSGGQRQRVALARAIYARCKIVLLDDSFSALDGKTEHSIVSNILGPEGHFKKMGTTVVMVTNSAMHFALADWLVILGDASVKYQGTWANLKQKPENILKVNVADHGNNLDNTVQSQALKVDEAISDLDRSTGDFSLYGYYIQAVGLKNFLVLVTCTLWYSFFITFPQYWLQRWMEAPPSQTMFYIGGYLILSLMAWACTNGSMWSTHMLIAPKSGAELHRRLLSTVMGAPLSLFSTTDTGSILNRFSQDIQLIDKQLPPAMLSISNQVFKLIVQTGLLFSAQKLMSLTLPLCMASVYLVQKVYLRTSRQLRLLDLESQSAVYSSFLESVEGVATIRAFGWEKAAEAANIRSLDQAQRPSYLLFCLQQWLSIVLDLMVSALAIGLIVLAVVLRGTTTAGQIGMALNIVIVTNTTLLGLVTSWTNLEISLSAIYRLKNLVLGTPTESKSSENYVPPETWPSSGAVELDDVTVAYNADALALRNVSMKVSAGQKLVVCGRTGSGKSTLLLSLLRLVEMRSGTIKIDGIDLSLVPRSLIRQRCFITITQDSFILGPASLRFNLDPSTSLPHESIVAALERTQLWHHFASGTPVSSGTMAARKILDSPMASLPQMSIGQSQMFALTRAILQLQALNHPSSLGNRGSIMPILLLDEATSSLDPDTESAMQSIMHQEFTEKGHTIVTITHRLSVVTENMRDQDMVALLSASKVERIGGMRDVLGSILPP